MSVRQVLPQLPIFRGLTPRELDQLEAAMRPMTLARNDTLFKEGEPGRACYVLLNGQISVYRRVAGHDERLAVLRPGSLVGHVALIDRRARSATCRASRSSTLLELPRKAFDSMFRGDSMFGFKIVERVARDMVSQLRASTSQLATAVTANTVQARRDSLRDAVNALMSGQRWDFKGVDLDSVQFTAGPRRGPRRDD